MSQNPNRPATPDEPEPGERMPTPPEELVRAAAATAGAVSRATADAQ